jgi:N-ethylmaleimide reductase
VRLGLEVAQAVVGIWGGERVGIPLDSDVMGTYGNLVEQLNPLGLVYVHCVEDETTGQRNTPSDMSFLELRRRFNGRDIANNDYDLRIATRVLLDGLADLIAFGRPFIANPDPVARLRNEWILTEAPKETWYGGGTKGYIGWPTYQKPPKDAAANYGQGI